MIGTLYDGTREIIRPILLTALGLKADSGYIDSYVESRIDRLIANIKKHRIPGVCVWLSAGNAISYTA